VATFVTGRYAFSVASAGLFLSGWATTFVRTTGEPNAAVDARSEAMTRRRLGFRSDVDRKLIVLLTGLASLPSFGGA